MRAMPPAARESDRGERPGAYHYRVECVTKSKSGQADQGADHPGIVPARFDPALANRRLRLAGHEGTADADQAKQYP